MNVDEAPPAPSAFAEAPRGVSGALVIGVALGLMLVAGAIAYLGVRRASEVDAPGWLVERFEVGALPLPLETARAHRLQGGSTLVVFEDPNAAPEPPRKEVAPSTANEGAETGAKTDWVAVPLGESGLAARTAVLLFAPIEQVASQSKVLFEDGDWRPIAELENEGGLVLIERGVLPWHGFDADFVHERLYEAGGTFRDAVRVNLSLPQKPCVLTLSWERSRRGSKAVVERWISALTPR